MLFQKKICEQFKCEFKEITFDLNYLKTNLVQILYDYDLLISGTGHFNFSCFVKSCKKNNTKVILTGSGGDEISGGYYWQKKAHKIPNTFFYSKKNKFFFTLDNFIKKNLFFKKKQIFKKALQTISTFFLSLLCIIWSHIALNLSFFMKDTYLKVEKKMEKLYDNYVNISDNVFCERIFTIILSIEIFL